MPGPQSWPQVPNRAATGKTKRDHATGKHARHLRNQAARREWNQQYMTLSKGGGRVHLAYPKIGDEP